MTNLIASIIISLSTNWVTFEKVIPIISKESGIYYQPSFLRQKGTRVTNVIVEVVYNGYTNHFKLDAILGDSCGIKEIPSLLQTK